MEKFKADLNKLYGQFNPIIYEIHQAVLDVQSHPSNSEKILKTATAKGKNLMTEIDKLIGQCMTLISTDPSINEDFTELLVSYKPRLQNELDLLDSSVKNPNSDEIEFIQDDQFDKMIHDTEAELLEQIQAEKEKLDQVKKVYENQEKLSEKELEERRQALKEQFAFTESMRDEMKKDWIQEDELQQFYEAKRKGLFSDDKNDKNDSLFDFLHDNSNNSSSDDEEMSFEKQQEVAKTLMANFLGTANEEESNIENNSENPNKEIVIPNTEVDESKDKDNDVQSRKESLDEEQN